MSDIRPRLLQDFLIPHLDQGTFKDKLCWVNRDEGLFRIFWRHQSSSKFCPDDSCVFQAWAMAKGLWDPNDIKCLTKAKQRLRAALLKLKSVKRIDKNGECRIYKIVSSHQAEFRDISNTLDREEEEANIFIDMLLRGY